MLFRSSGNTSGDLLSFDGTNWTRRARLDGTQFGVSGNTSGDLLSFDGTNWVRRARLDGTQFGVSGNTSGDLLSFDGTNWTRRARLDGTQFGVSGNTTGDLLSFDGSNWVRRARIDGTQFGVSGNVAGDFLTFDGNNWVRTTNTVPAGTMVLYGGSSSPTGWLLCDGSAVSRSTYAQLFSALGTAYGTGDGSTTFNLPDLRQRFPLGLAASGTGNVLGTSGGNIDHTHTGPSHTHAYSGNTLTASSNTSNMLAGTTPVAVQGHDHTYSGTSSASGTGDTGSANPPYQVVNYIIKY